MDVIHKALLTTVLAISTHLLHLHPPLLLYALKFDRKKLERRSGEKEESG